MNEVYSNLIKGIVAGNKDALQAAKMLTEYSGGPSAEAVDFVKQHHGKRCKVNLIGEYGTIVGLNTRTGGSYSGDRYPVYVQLEGGSTYEYDLTDIQLED